MEYKLFDEYITLQALLKEVGIIQSGGAIKAYLAEHEVYFNGEREERRGKKIRLGDTITIPEENIQITLLEPSLEEINEHKEDLEEKARVAKLVKEMNKTIKKQNQNQPSKKTSKPKQGNHKNQRKTSQAPKKAPVRFPGT